jgi:HD-like signal output (HDOD) protein
VRQAVSVLGFSMLSRTVSGLVLRQVLSAGQREALEAFWERSSKLAAATYYVAKQFPGMNRDEAYTYGLFQHCGIPLLLLRFPEYVGTLRHAAAASDRPLTDFEESAHGTNHATVGYLLARTWYLPDDVAEAIRNHHECAQLGDHPATLTEGTRNLLAIGLLSECAVTTQARQAPTADWIAAGDLALEFLGIGQDELDEIVADIGLLIG